MGNIFQQQKDKCYLDACIKATKRDIVTNYDITKETQVELANVELLESFSKFHKMDIEYVKTQLFTLNDPDYSFH
jgi:hypothetical protein